MWEGECPVREVGLAQVQFLAGVAVCEQSRIFRKVGALLEVRNGPMRGVIGSSGAGTAALVILAMLR